jgi:hypothetical protein
MSATEPRHDVQVKHAARARQRKDLMADLVGLEVVYLAEDLDEIVDVWDWGHHVYVRKSKRELGISRLYPERVGNRCRIVGLNPHEEHCPLVVEWPEGQRGIAEPEWLMEVTHA